MNDFLLKFCGRDPRRQNLHKPWSRGEWTYATDGRVAIRVPRISSIEENPSAPAAETLPFGDETTPFAPAPEIKISLNTSPCEDCDGRGYLHDCPTCECACSFCEGTGDVLEKQTIGIGPATFNAKYIKRIQILPGLRFGPADKANAMPFRFDGGGEGLVMPMRWEGTRDIEVRVAA